MPIRACIKCAKPRTNYEVEHCDEKECPLKPGPARWSGDKVDTTTPPEVVKRRPGRPARVKQ